MAEQSSHRIPNLAELAHQYGTINTEQFQHIIKLHALKKDQGESASFGQLILNLNFATQYQVGLLKLIEDYLIIKKKGEVFGKIAIDKGYATEKEIAKALEKQKKAFREIKLKKLIGDILVESGVITIKQRDEILEEQEFIDRESQRILAKQAPGKQSQDTEDIKKPDPLLSEFEQKFLQIKVLDKEFAARVIEKGFASPNQVKIAQTAQEESFEKEQRIQMLGDFMVDLKFMTEDQKYLVLQEQNRMDEATPSSKKDKDLSLAISQDKMQAVVTIQPDMGMPTLRDIKQVLEKKGVRFGIYPDALLQCHIDLNNFKFVAARQDASFERLKEKKAVYYFDISHADRQEKKMGAPLAEQTLVSGVFIKKDVFGNNQEQTQGYGFTFRCASGVRLSDDSTKAFASKTGFPSLSIEKKLYIHPAVSVLEDANLSYGPLDNYANLSILGMLTGAYPVTAGDLSVKEIRGARVEAIGTIRVEIGIIDSLISAQGDIHAKYLHGCRIETFGNVYVENEIIDSEIYCSGKIDSKKCLVVSSNLYAKKGIDLEGVGNERTKSCILVAGSEHHVLQKVRQLHRKIEDACLPLEKLRDKKEEKDRAASHIFQKMVEFKIYYDRAKEKKIKLSDEFKKKKDEADKNELKNIVKLVQGFENRMQEAIDSLKQLNEQKKKMDKESALLAQKIQKLERQTNDVISDIQTDILALYEWARKEENRPCIKIRKQAFPGTCFKGVYSQLTIETPLNNFSIQERQTAKGDFNLVVEP